MLVLTRKIGEEILIGSNIRITILSVSRGQVKIGIEAPKTVPVYRKEIYDRICSYNRNATQINMERIPELLRSSPLNINRVLQNIKGTNGPAETA